MTDYLSFFHLTVKCACIRWIHRAHLHMIPVIIVNLHQQPGPFFSTLWSHHFLEWTKHRPLQTGGVKRWNVARRSIVLVNVTSSKVRPLWCHKAKNTDVSIEIHHIFFLNQYFGSITYVFPCFSRGVSIPRMCPSALKHQVAKLLPGFRLLNQIGQPLFELLQSALLCHASSVETFFVWNGTEVNTKYQQQNIFLSPQFLESPLRWTS